MHLGTLGTGNHFIEVCLDEEGSVWFMLHSGSRGVGNFIGTMFIELARQDAMRHQANLPDRDLAYFEEGSRYFGDYVRGVGWAQKFARLNREVMMGRVIEAVRALITKPIEARVEAVVDAFSTAMGWGERSTRAINLITQAFRLKAR